MLLDRSPPTARPTYQTMRPGLLLGFYLTLLGSTALTTATLAAITLSAVPSTMEFILQNWAWVKTRAIPFSEPLGIATSTAASMSRLAIVLIALAGLQALSFVNLLLLLSRRGVLALVPFAAHFTTFGLAVVTVGSGFYLGQVRVACRCQPACQPNCQPDRQPECLPIASRLPAKCQPIASRLPADCQPIARRLPADCPPIACRLPAHGHPGRERMPMRVAGSDLSPGPDTESASPDCHSIAFWFAAWCGLPTDQCLPTD